MRLVCTHSMRARDYAESCDRNTIKTTLTNLLEIKIRILVQANYRFPTWRHSMQQNNWSVFFPTILVTRQRHFNETWNLNGVKSSLLLFFFYSNIVQIWLGSFKHNNYGSNQAEEPTGDLRVVSPPSLFISNVTCSIINLIKFSHFLVCPLYIFPFHFLLIFQNLI